MTQEEIVSHLSDRWWRINNLYYIRDEKGNKVLFRCNDVQKELYENLWYFNIVPKARQLGITTFFTILYLDQVLFSENRTAGIIAHRQEDMKKIFRNKIKFAWDNLPGWLRAYIGEPDTNSAQELVFPNGSTIFVSMSSRGNTVQLLHISEFGYICKNAPEKAAEIVSGAINSVHAGQMVSIESTAEGKEGYFYDFCMEAEKMRKEGRELTPLDFKIFFFPWYRDPRYTLDGNFALAKEDTDYFKLMKDKHGIILTEGQMRWYVKKKKINGEKMTSQFPSTLDEAFSNSVEGAYYAKQMSRVYMERRIAPIPYDPMLDVESWWDLGVNDFNVILLTQTTKQGFVHFIDMYFNHGEPLKHYVDWLKDRKDEVGYRYTRHHLPHDVEVTDLSTGKTRKETLVALGLSGIVVGQKLGIQDGIDNVRRIFPRFRFDEQKCQKLHEALFNYRKDFDTKLGVWKDKPRHDDNSHFADAVRLLANEWREPIAETVLEHESANQSFFA